MTCRFCKIQTVKIKKVFCSFCCSELLEMTCRLANTLKAHGVQKGDRVAIYLPTSPLAVAAMLACARIGAVHTVVFAGFSAEALAGRIQDGEEQQVLHRHLFNWLTVMTF